MVSDIIRPAGRDLVDDARALNEAVAIVRDVAALETPFDDLDCHFCGVYRWRTEERETVEVTIDEHEDDCPWRLAVEWVAAHPVSGDQQ